MSTTATFAGKLAEAPELHHARNHKPLVSRLVLVNRRVQNDQWEWASDDPTAHSAEAFGSATAHDSYGSGDSILGRGLERTESRPDKVTSQKRSNGNVVVAHRFSGVGVSLDCGCGLIDGAPCPTQAS